MASKRQHPDSGGTPLSGPPSKKTQFEPVRLGPIATLEEMDMKVLQFQNRKLTERLDQRQKQEGELRKRIEQLEKRQTTDDAVLCIVNRYWNQLDEDMRVLLQRFDYETSDEAENKNESEATTSFLTLLSTWDKQELDEKLSQRVQFSKRAVGKLLQTFDRLLQRNEKITLALKGETSDEPLNLDEAVKEANIELQAENGRLQCLVTQLHEKHHATSLKFTDLQDKYNAVETELAEIKNRLEDVEYDLAKEQQRSEKLDAHLTEALAKLKNYESDGKEGKPVSVGHRLGGHKMDEQEAEEMKELAANRLAELEKLHQEHKDALKEVEKLKMELQQLPESVILESTEYKCLQSQFSVLYNESMQMKTQLEETRTLLQSSKNAHLRQIEQMESEELAAQKKLRTEVIQLEDTLAQVRKEYEMLRIEFEQTLAANEQTGPINREMRHLITSLQNHNQQLKGEVARYKRKLKESQSELNKVKNDIHKIEVKGNPCGGCEEITPSTSKEEPVIKKEEDREEENPRERGKSDADIIKDLKSQLKLYRKSQEAQKEMKLLLDMYKGVAKEQRDKVQLAAAESKYTQHTLKHAMWKNKLMAAEKRAKGEVEELKSQLRKMQENERKERKKLADDDAIRKIKSLEETIQQLQKNLAATKQEEDALLSEMEVTGQAFEDMQEQNVRLLQQLREKDDANFKLMSERIKSNQIHKLLREEKDMLGEQVTTLQTQVETQNQVVRKLEEKERILQNNLSTVEKELSLRQQSMEMHKRKAIESAQSAADLKLHLDKYHAQLKEAQSTVADKTGALEQESFKIKRLQEEVASLRRKLERAKKFELAGAADEVLMEEIREYKEQLTCPSCKVKRKDGVLTKCFHVFCFDCLKTRYETRQRKCPKCNAAFGVNDYHRLYLG